MSQKYQVELSDGRKFIVESDGGPPSEADILAYMDEGQQQQPPDAAFFQAARDQAVAKGYEGRENAGMAEYAGNMLGGAWDHVKDMGRGIASNMQLGLDRTTGKAPMPTISESMSNLGSMAKTALVDTPAAVMGAINTDDPREAGARAVDAALMIPGIISGTRGVSTAAGAARGPVSSGLQRVGGALATDFPNTTVGGVGRTAERIGRRIEPAAPRAAGLDPYMPNTTASSTATAPASGPMPQPASVMVDRYAPNTPAASHAPDPTAGAMRMPPPAVIDRYMPNTPALKMEPSIEWLHDAPSVEQIPLGTTNRRGTGAGPLARPEGLLDEVDALAAAIPETPRRGVPGVIAEGPPLPAASKSKGATKMSANDMKVYTDAIKSGMSQDEAIAEMLKQRATRASANYNTHREAAAARRGQQ